MHYSWIPRHTQSMMILTEYFWKFQWKLHCGNVVNLIMQVKLSMWGRSTSGWYISCSKKHHLCDTEIAVTKHSMHAHGVYAWLRKSAHEEIWPNFTKTFFGLMFLVMCVYCVAYLLKRYNIQSFICSFQVPLKIRIQCQTFKLGMLRLLTFREAVPFILRHLVSENPNKRHIGCHQRFSRIGVLSTSALWGIFK